MGDIGKIGGALVSAQGSLLAGEGAQQAANYRAAQLRQNAGQEKAASQRVAEDDLRKAQLMMSRALAVAGASGAGVTDPTVINIMGNIAKEGKLASLASLYEGDTAAAGLRRQADVAVYEGEQAKTASEYQAMGTLLSAGGSMSDMFKSEPGDKEAPKEKRATKSSGSSPQDYGGYAWGFK